MCDVNLENLNAFSLNLTPPSFFFPRQPGHFSYLVQLILLASATKKKILVAMGFEPMRIAPPGLSVKVSLNLAFKELARMRVKDG